LSGKSTKITCKDCKFFPKCKGEKKDSCDIKILIEVSNQLLGAI